MTAGGKISENDSEKSDCSANNTCNPSQREFDDRVKNMGSNSYVVDQKSNCNIEMWEERKKTPQDLTTEYAPLQATTTVSERVEGQYTYPTSSCCLPATHATLASLSQSNCDEQPVSASASNKQDYYPYCNARNVNSRWLSYRGSSAPPINDDYHASSSSFKGGGCSVLLDKSVDLIELMTEEEDNSQLPQSNSCTCCNKQLKKWRFSQNKCKSLDCSGVKNLPSFQTPFVSCFSTEDNMNIGTGMPKTRVCYNSDGFKIQHCASCDSSLITDVSLNPVSGISDVGLCVIPNIDCGEAEAKGGHGRSVEEEFRLRSLSLTPTVNLAIFETESSDDDNNASSSIDTTNNNCNFSDVFSSSNNGLNNLDSQLGLQSVSVPLLNRTIPCSPSAAQLSLASTMTDGGAPICKICHMTSKDGDPLISPCRCSGTMQYIHCGCLMHWLEISSKKSRKPPSCELCQYQYHWHKKFKVRHWQFPHCSRRDKVLHVLFFISVMIMVACATITILCFKQDKGTKVDPDRTELTDSEIVTLVCGVLFFLAFFVAMYVEVKARNTIYKLLVRFVYLNQQWYIDEYEKKDSAPVSV